MICIYIVLTLHVFCILDTDKPVSWKKKPEEITKHYFSQVTHQKIDIKKLHTQFNDLIWQALLYGFMKRDSS